MASPKVTLIYQTIQSFTDDLEGGAEPTWVSRRKIKGLLSVIKGSESFVADQLTTTVAYRFYCKEPDDITITENGQFLLGNLKTFSIQYVNESHGNMLQIDMTEAR